MQKPLPPIWIGSLVGATVVPLVLWRYGEFLGADPNLQLLVLGSALGLICATIVSIMDCMERRAGKNVAPSSAVTKVVIGITPLCFWIPFLGPAIAFAAIYRTQWLELPEWMRFVLNTAFLIGVAITLVALLIVAMDIVGP